MKTKSRVLRNILKACYEALRHGAAEFDPRNNYSWVYDIGWSAHGVPTLRVRIFIDSANRVSIDLTNGSVLGNTILASIEKLPLLWRLRFRWLVWRSSKLVAVADDEKDIEIIDKILSDERGKPNVKSA